MEESHYQLELQCLTKQSDKLTPTLFGHIFRQQADCLSSCFNNTVFFFQIFLKLKYDILKIKNLSCQSLNFLFFVKKLDVDINRLSGLQSPMGKLIKRQYPLCYTSLIWGQLPTTSEESVPAGIWPACNCSIVTFLSSSSCLSCSTMASILRVSSESSRPWRSNRSLNCRET